MEHEYDFFNHEAILRRNSKTSVSKKAHRILSEVQGFAAHALLNFFLCSWVVSGTIEIIDTKCISTATFLFLFPFLCGSIAMTALATARNTVNLFRRFVLISRDED